MNSFTSKIGLQLVLLVLCISALVTANKGPSKETESKIKSLKECNQNLARFVKCMELSPTFNTKDRYQTHPDDCYGMIHSNCLKTYCKDDQYKPIREFEYCKWWFFGCEKLTDQICGKKLL